MQGIDAIAFEHVRAFIRNAVREIRHFEVPSTAWVGSLLQELEARLPAAHYGEVLNQIERQLRKHRTRQLQLF